MPLPAFPGAVTPAEPVALSDLALLLEMRALARLPESVEALSVLIAAELDRLVAAESAQPSADDGRANACGERGPLAH